MVDYFILISHGGFIRIQLLILRNFVMVVCIPSDRMWINRGAKLFETYPAWKAVRKVSFV